jgi:micrococcal nuclease
MYEYQARVLSVHDGDTMRLDVDLGFNVHNINMDMRVSGFDAPELGRSDKLGEIARDAVLAWLASHIGPYLILTRKDQAEKYGRYLLARVLAVDGHDLIADQIAAGFLKPYSGTGAKPTWP